jgi:hypothetical protein
LAVPGRAEALCGPTGTSGHEQLTAPDAVGRRDPRQRTFWLRLIPSWSVFYKFIQGVSTALGLLCADNLLAETWDDWATPAVGSGSIMSGRLWLPHYEAVLRGWTNNQEIIQAIRADAFFMPLLEANISFLDNSDF